MKSNKTQTTTSKGIIDENVYEISIEELGKIYRIKMTSSVPLCLCASVPTSFFTNPVLVVFIWVGCKA